MHDDDDADKPATLTVRGEADLDKPADQVSISIGVTTEHEDAAKALKQNNDRMDKVIEAIEDAGLTKDDYSTGRFQVRPKYQPRPRQPVENWEPKIIGYEATNTLNVETKKLDLIGQIIQEANKAGANTIDSISFDLANPRQYREEAIREATKNAIADAKILADAAGVRLMRTRSINVDNAAPAPPNPMSKRMMMSSRGVADSAAPINPGDVTIRATVTITYEIEDAN